ncbi:MAG: Nif3-like dinuclear metal center hexameric protein [Planctomycetota bacterium]|nr:Nif3-like dinuclear metal center hexameric protein [Planctomycetota bacterium]
MPLVRELVAAMEVLAPVELAEAWDNVGLLAGDESERLPGPVLVTVDFTEAVLGEASRVGAGAVVAYHPPIFRPLTRVVAADGPSRALLGALRRGMAVYSPHTALDAAPGGVTELLMHIAAGGSAEEFGRSGGGGAGGKLKEMSALRPGTRRRASQTHKVVTFVPEAALERVRSAMAQAGAGRIGAYDLCSFTMPGTGSFRGGAGSNPAVGEPGRLEFVSEVRLEMVSSAAGLAGVLRALAGAHPYEEPAVEVYALTADPDPSRGPGRVGVLERPASVGAIAERLRTGLGAGAVMAALPGGKSLASVVERIAAVPGSGASLVDDAVREGAECFVTGGMKHHEVLAAIDRGCAVILAGHTETERAYMPVLARRLNEMDGTFGARVSGADRPPLIVVR